MHSESMHSQQQHDSTPHPVSWAVARQATLHCLTGCAIGEVLGMAIGTSLGLPDAGTVVPAVALAFDNAVMLGVPGAMGAGIGSLVFWASLAGSLAVAFVVPVNRALMSRGRGHAVVHGLH
jgi:hypothetical protein